MTDELHDATTLFGTTYRLVKGDKENEEEGWEKILETDKRTFYDALTARLESGTLARKVVAFDGKTPVDEWVIKYHPGWRVKSVKEGKAQLEEDPALKKDSYVNPDDGYVYARSQQKKAAVVDEERLQEEDPELWKEVSYWPQYELVFAAMSHVFQVVHNPDPETVAGEEAEKFLADAPRELLPSSGWTVKQAARVKKYVLPGRISTHLVPPRKATEHELETGEADA